MARTPQDVTDAELAVLEVLWREGQATVRFIAEELYDDASSSHHATVQKLLDRLKAKDCVTRDSSVWPHVFQATIEREQLIGQRLRMTAEKLCNGSLQPLLTHLVRASKLTRKERQSLRDLLDQLDQEKKQRQRRGPK